MDNIMFAKHLRKPEGNIGIAIGNFMNEINGYINQFTLKKMELNSDDSILEIGMGNGKFISSIFEINPALHYTGLDISKTMIDEAIKHNAIYYKQNKVKFILGSSEKIDVSDSIYDKALLINTIYFWAQPIDHLKEIHRVLKNEGKIYLSHRSKKTLQSDPISEHGFKLYDDIEIVNFLTEAGFREVIIEKETEPDKKLDIICINAKK